MLYFVVSLYINIGWIPHFGPSEGTLSRAPAAGAEKPAAAPRDVAPSEVAAPAGWGFSVKIIRNTFRNLKSVKREKKVVLKMKYFSKHTPKIKSSVRAKDRDRQALIVKRKKAARYFPILYVSNILIVQICPTGVRVGAFSAVRFRPGLLGLFGVPLSTRRAEKKGKRKKVKKIPA